MARGATCSTASRALISDKEGTRLILDFNFAYQRSCSYDPSWMCPLTPAASRLTLPILAGERLAAG
jgi:uncharacterized protein (DUF1684 family)